MFNLRFKFSFYLLYFFCFQKYCKILRDNDQWFGKRYRDHKNSLELFKIIYYYVFLHKVMNSNVCIHITFCLYYSSARFLILLHLTFYIYVFMRHSLKKFCNVVTFLSLVNVNCFCKTY